MKTKCQRCGKELENNTKVLCIKCLETWVVCEGPDEITDCDLQLASWVKQNTKRRDTK